MLTAVPSTSAEAYHNGTQLSVVKKHNPEQMRVALILAIKQVCDIVSAKTTITSDLELGMLVSEIEKDFWFMKLEEILLVFKAMALKGGWYERLKAGDFLDELRNYDRNERENLSLSANEAPRFNDQGQGDTNILLELKEAFKPPQNEPTLKTNKKIDFDIPHDILAELRAEHDEDYKKVMDGKMSKDKYLKKWEHSK